MKGEAHGLRAAKLPNMVSLVYQVFESLGALVILQEMADETVGSAAAIHQVKT